ncbi:MAG: hypothetical protein IT332_10495 [Ardenticatenales bacterium]|nr:hypothetical protein [Ardenticatenales bacterium]
MWPSTDSDRPPWCFGATRDAAALAAEPDGTLWVGARSHPLRVRRADGGWGEIADGPPLGAVREIAVAPGGRVWVGMAERGARGFDRVP